MMSFTGQQTCSHKGLEGRINTMPVPSFTDHGLLPAHSRC